MYIAYKANCLQNIVAITAVDGLDSDYLTAEEIAEGRYEAAYDDEMVSTPTWDVDAEHISRSEFIRLKKSGITEI